MRPMRKMATLLLVACSLMPASSLAQRQGEITFYSDIAFRGRTYVVTGPRENISIPFLVRSARVSPGDSWQVCTGRGYSGLCNRVSDNAGNVAWRVASARPEGGNRPGTGAPGVNQSLRGMSAEFFYQPTSDGRRIESCASGAAACATESANRFCQARGWTASSYERQETVAGRNYLADVLCTRTR